MLEEKFGASAMRDHIKKIFDGDEDIAKWLNKLSEDDVRSLANKLKRGVHYASPVFDGAQELADQEHPGTRGSTDERPDGALRRAHAARRSTRRSPWA